MRTHPTITRDSDTTLGLNRLNVALCEYRKEWAACYASEEVLLRKLLGDDLIAVAHVGSTAIPGVAAKPIIDIMVSVPTLDCAERHSDVLTTAGYERRANADGPDRRFFAKGTHSRRTHHLSMTLACSEYWRRTLSFRDYLIGNADVAKQYEVLKRRLAVSFPNDRASYTEGKSAFIAEVLAIAKARNEV